MTANGTYNHAEREFLNDMIPYAQAAAIMQQAEDRILVLLGGEADRVDIGDIWTRLFDLGAIPSNERGLFEEYCDMFIEYGGLL